MLNQAWFYYEFIVIIVIWNIHVPVIVVYSRLFCTFIIPLDLFSLLVQSITWWDSVCVCCILYIKCEGFLQSNRISVCLQDLFTFIPVILTHKFVYISLNMCECDSECGFYTVGYKDSLFFKNIKSCSFNNWFLAHHFYILPAMARFLVFIIYKVSKVL